MVASSLRAEERAAGRVPYQPRVDAAGRVRCNFRNTDVVGTRGGRSSFEDRGLSDAKIVRELRML